LRDPLRDRGDGRDGVPAVNPDWERDRLPMGYDPLRINPPNFPGGPPGPGRPGFPPPGGPSPFNPRGGGSFGGPRFL
jgi:hypothetical protein